MMLLFMAAPTDPLHLRQIWNPKMPADQGLHDYGQNDNYDCFRHFVINQLLILIIHHIGKSSFIFIALV